MNSALDQVDLINIDRNLHLKSTEYTFSVPHHTYSKIDHIIGSKTLRLKKKNRNHNKQSLRPQFNRIRT